MRFHSYHPRRRVARWASALALSAILPLVWAGTSFAATMQVGITAQPTATPNSYQVTVAVSGVSAGDVIDVQIYNTQTYAMVQQFYTSAPSGSFQFVTNTMALPASQSLAYQVYVKTSNWSSNLYSQGGLAPFTTTRIPPTVLLQAQAYYPNWLRQYVQTAPQGLRVVNTDLNNVTVSEGQGYGMLIAALAKDSTTFAGLWHYAQSFLDANGLMNWEISSTGSVIGATSATNGDEAMAEALLIAGAEWPGHGYHQAGVAMANAIYAHDLIPGTPLIGPGDGWPANNTDIAPGYIDPYAYQLFAQATGNTSWTKVLSANEQWLASTGANATTGLVPDWETTSGAAVVPPGSQNPSESDAYYENAVPYPIWLVQWLMHGGHITAASRLSQFFQTAPMSDGYTLTGTALSSGYTNMPFLSGMGTFLLASDPTSSAAQSVYQQVLTQQANTYYGSTLKALALFMLGNPSYPAIAGPPAWTPPVLHSENFEWGGRQESVIGNLGFNSPPAIVTGTYVGYVEERAAIAAGATFSGEGTNSSYLSAILSGAGVGLQRHVSAIQQGQFAALYQRLGIVPTWMNNTVTVAAGVQALLTAHAPTLAIENYLVQMDGFSWSVAARDASRGFLIR